MTFIRGQHGDTERLHPPPGRGLCVGFAFSPCVFVGSLQVLQLPPTVHRHAVSGVKFTGDSESPRGVSLNGHQSFQVRVPGNKTKL